MMKENKSLKEYASPEMEIVVFETDVIITSDGETGTKKVSMFFEEEPNE